MEDFYDIILGVGPICNANFLVTFDKAAITIRDSEGNLISTG